MTDNKERNNQSGIKRTIDILKDYAYIQDNFVSLEHKDNISEGIHRQRYMLLVESENRQKIIDELETSFRFNIPQTTKRRTGND